jgi:ABC-type molybdate transport system permease subunit
MTNPPEKPITKQYLLNMTLAGLVGQVGCVTLIIILGALFLGLWIDAQFATRPWFTIGLVIASIPVSLIIMVVVARAAISKIKAGTGKSNDPS